jgi:hypothetical protein
LLKSSFVFLSTAGEFGCESGNVRSSDVNDLVGRIDQWNVEKALFEMGGIDSESVVKFWIRKYRSATGGTLDSHKPFVVTGLDGSVFLLKTLQSLEIWLESWRD